MNEYVCNSYKTDPRPRLDRLTALLHGLAPAFDVLRPDADTGSGALPSGEADHALHLHLLTSGEARLRMAGAPVRQVSAPAVVVCRADRAVVPEIVEPGALVSVRARFGGPAAPLLMEEFGAVLVVPLDDADGALAQVVVLIATEIAAPRCGQPALLERAGDILFIGLLRHLIAHPRTDGGLFGGLADARIARALVAMHSAPAHGWTLERLADEAGMSRTAFAQRFRQIMHCPPGAYLGRLRLAIARRALDSGASLKRAAGLCGYSGPATLSRALAQSRRRAA